MLSNIKIISARGEYQSLFPTDIKQWKINSFLQIQKEFDPDLLTNIFCMGDSIIEMEAAHILASKFSQVFIKTIKFKDTPKPEELLKQISLLVNDKINNIFSSVKNLSISVEKMKK